MLRTDQMKNDALEEREECVRLRARADLLTAWEQLKKTMLWGAIEGNLKQIEEHAIARCIDRNTSDVERRECAAEARVYRGLRMRPESVALELERIASQLKEREAEIKRLEGLTKGV